MSLINIVRQGESYAFEFNRDGDSIDGWVCTITVKVFPGDTAIISRVITPSVKKWEGFLTQSETKDLSIGHHRLIGKLTHAGDDKEEQKINRFNVVKSWA